MLTQEQIVKIKQCFDNISTNDIYFNYPIDDICSNLASKILQNKVIMIGIMGETASGKSTLSKIIKKVLIQQLHLPITFLTTDNYYKDISKIRNGKDFVELVLYDGYDSDSPNGIQMDVLTKDLQQLKNDIDIYSPTYALDNTGKSIPNSLFVKSNKLILIEGVACSYLNIPDFFDVKIYVDVDKKIRKDRFFKRASERLMFGENVDKYWKYTCLCGEKYVQPLKKCSDVVVSGEIDVKIIEDVVLNLCKYFVF